MCRVYHRLVLAVILLLSPGFSARSEPPREDSKPAPEGNKPVRTDLYGDLLPPGALVRMGTMRWRHDHAYASLATALSPDGNTLATAGSLSLRLWDVASGKLLWQVQGNYYSMMRFSPDGRWLVVAGDNLLDAATGRRVLRFPESAYPLAFSPDSRLLAVGSKEGSVILWHTATGKEAGRLKSNEAAPQNSQVDSVVSGVFTPDGQDFIGLYLYERKRICRWNIASERLLKTVEMPIPQQRTLQLSPDGRTLALTPYSRDPVGLWDTDTGKERCKLQGDGASANYGLAFSPDGRTLATDLNKYPSEEAQISVWDTGTGKLLRRFAVPPRAVGHLEWAADGRTLLSASQEARVRLWDSVTGKSLFEQPAHDSAVTSLSFAPDGQTLVSGSQDGTVRLWDVATGRHQHPLTGHKKGGYQVAVLPDGSSVLSSGHDGRLFLQDLQTGKELRCMIPDPDEGKSPYISQIPSFSVSIDGRTAASSKGTEKATLLHVWDLATGRPLVSRTDTLNAVSLIFSPDARILAAHVNTVIPSPNRDPNAPMKGKEVQGTTTTQIVLQDLATGRQILTLPQPDRSAYRAAFAPDGRTLLTVTSRDLGRRDGLNLQAYTYHLWELASGKERLTFANPETVYNWYSEQIAFTPDGRSFATALADKTIRILDTATGKEWLRRSGYEASVRSLAFAPGGKSLASGHADSTILLWDLTPELSQRAPAAKAGAEELEIWWTDLAGPDARKAHAAMWSLAALSQQAVPLLRDRLRPAAAVPADRLRQLLADLDSKQSKSREAASKQLAELEEQAESSLQEALNAKPSPEKRRRIEALLAAPRIVRSPETLRHLRAVEVLELSNSPEAPPILETLANGAPEARLTQDANASLKRLARR